MKKHFISSVVLLLFVIVVSSPVYAQVQTIDHQGVAGLSITPTPTPVDYQLPYPGLLPDNPLYKLKTLRDKIISFLISDPLKKAEFDLLQSDKRLAASSMLLKQTSPSDQLIGDTLSKGDNYFSQGIEQLSLSKKQGLDTTDMTHKFYISSLKHAEVIQEMLIIADMQLKPILQKEDSRVAQYTTQVSPSMGNK